MSELSIDVDGGERRSYVWCATWKGHDYPADGTDEKHAATFLALGLTASRIATLADIDGTEIAVNGLRFRVETRGEIGSPSEPAVLLVRAA